MVDRIDDGRNRLLDGLIYDSLIINTFTIQDKEPNSANVALRPSDRDQSRRLGDPHRNVQHHEQRQGLFPFDQYTGCL